MARELQEKDKLLRAAERMTKMAQAAEEARKKLEEEKRKEEASRVPPGQRT